ncbi:hypothetical protein Moror_554 [Moniliophthora roreri MCA 2997]|uniref:DUF6534 domain-containing protein n=1 Tax=Moniliophthora roreri (strain MCA 2997) TaxID=1381753 RepID=V2WD91_MONRO|nr:hypothetical protein Moror_554 [Moniliophthora roreri MCA 2997]
MSSPLPIPPNIVELTGPIFLGNIFNWGLFGALSVQTYLYYLAFPRDRSIPKGIVASVYVFELVQTILCTKDAFNNFGFGWGNMEAFDQVGLIWFSVPMMTGIVSCAVQLFFAWRIWIISRSFYIPIVIGVLSLVQCSGSIWAGVHCKEIGVWSELQEQNQAATILWLGGTAACDVLITVTMLYYLSTSRNGFRATNAILVKFIRLTIETGLITSTFAVLDLMFFLIFKHANYHLVPATCLSKFYSNSLMVLLNARIRILNGRDVGFTTTDETLSWIPSGSTLQNSEPSITYRLPSMSISAKENPRPVNISVTTDVETTLDPAVKKTSFDEASNDGDK